MGGGENRVYAFEPSGENFLALTRNFQLNHFDTSSLFHMGLYQENKTVDFYYDVEATGASSMVDLREQGTVRVEQVEMKRLDDVVKENKIPRIDFIKCDVEGSELFVFKGGMESLKKFKPVIFCEMLRKWTKKYKYHPNDIIHLLASLGYSCYALSKGGLVSVEQVTEDTVETNFFFLNQEKHGGFLKSLE